MLFPDPGWRPCRSSGWPPRWCCSPGRKDRPCCNGPLDQFSAAFHLPPDLFQFDDFYPLAVLLNVLYAAWAFPSPQSRKPMLRRTKPVAISTAPDWFVMSEAIQCRLILTPLMTKR